VEHILYFNDGKECEVMQRVVYPYFRDGLRSRLTNWIPTFV